MKNVLLSIATAFALLFGLATTLSAQNAVVWKGGTPGQENNWNCPKNWSKYKVPDEFSDVVIPDVSSTTHATPVIKSGTFEVNSIQIQSNAQLTIESGARLVVYNAETAFDQAGNLQLNGSILTSTTAGNELCDTVKFHQLQAAFSM